MTEAESTGFVTYHIDNPRVPVLLSVPHAGRDYPDAVFKNLRLPPEMLIRLEDRYADLLARKAIAAAVPAIIATRPRAWIDLNRDEQDIDVAMVDGMDGAGLPTPGRKQRGGLGLIPRRLSGAGDIWKRPLTAADVRQRISGFHQLYHRRISQTLEAMRDEFGIAILLDLHSMPPVSAISDGPPPRFVIGDAFGRSASGQYTELSLGYLRQPGHAAALNHPYSGDYILRRHARPDEGIHAIQLEVDRSLYLDELLREPVSGVQAISTLVAGLVSLLADTAIGDKTLLAAE